MRYQCSRRFTCIIIIFYIGMIRHKRISSTGGYLILFVVFNAIYILFAIKQRKLTPVFHLVSVYN